MHEGSSGGRSLKGSSGGGGIGRCVLIGLVINLVMMVCHRPTSKGDKVHEPVNFLF